MLEALTNSLLLYRIEFGFVWFLKDNGIIHAPLLLDALAIATN